MGTVVRRIMLSGALRGSAVMTESGGETRLELSLRGMTGEESIFSVGKKGIVRTKLTDGMLPQTDVCAIVITRRGRLVSGGFTDGCARERGRLLDEIRIRASEQEQSPNEPEPPKAHESRPASSVTESILESAERLFSRRDVEENDAPKREFSRIPNPFPRTLPRSVWREKEGDARLYGELPSERGIIRLIALPMGMRGGELFIRGQVTAKDGRRYVIVRENGSAD